MEFRGDVTFWLVPVDVFLLVQHTVTRPYAACAVTLPLSIGCSIRRTCQYDYVQRVAASHRMLQSYVKGSGGLDVTDPQPYTSLHDTVPQFQDPEIHNDQMDSL